MTETDQTTQLPDDAAEPIPTPPPDQPAPDMATPAVDMATPAPDMATPAPEPPQPDQPDPLRDALRQAADALRQLAIATERDIVPELITGDTPDEVRASIERSRAAYRAALAHIARTLPTPPTPTPADTTPADPITLISRGLSRKE